MYRTIVRYTKERDKEHKRHKKHKISCASCASCVPFPAFFMQSMILTARARLESALGERIPSPFTDLDRRVLESVPTGIASLDALTGGLPRGGITEISGPPSSGRTSAMV